MIITEQRSSDSSRAIPHSISTIMSFPHDDQAEPLHICRLQRIFADESSDRPNRQSSFLWTRSALNLGSPACDTPFQMFDEGVTTYKLKKIPRSLDKAKLCALWPPTRSLNILYLPWNAQRRHCFYAFVN